MKKRVRTCKNCRYFEFVETYKHVCHFGGEKMFVGSKSSCEEFEYKQEILEEK